jgi:hypothetical protein
MSDLEIERVQVYAVGPETARYTWASDMADQFMTHNLIRITTRSGVEGIARQGCPRRTADRAAGPWRGHPDSRSGRPAPPLHSTRGVIKRGQYPATSSLPFQTLAEADRPLD